MVALIWLAPTIGLLVTSFRPRTDIQATGWWETLSTLRFTTENYEQVLNAQGMGQAFINNMIIAIPSTLLPLTLARWRPTRSRGCNSRSATRSS